MECTSLTNIIIPKNVNHIGINVFYKCTNLITVTVLATTPPYIGSSAFLYTNPNLKIFVPSGSLTAYQSKANWYDYPNIIKAIE